MIERWLNKLPTKFPSALLDEHVVMPDHFNAIVLLQCSSDLECLPVSLPTVMQWFKTMTTAEYFRRVRSDNWPRVHGRLWQRSYYDHIIRSEEDLANIRSYIVTNPGALLERFAGQRSGPTGTARK
jgi:REP element-mobilizing transposase RayT